MNNFTVRTLSGIGFVAIMLVCLLTDKFLFAALVLVLISGMMTEFYSLTMGDDYKAARVMATFTGCLMFSLVFLRKAYGIPESFMSLTFISIIILMAMTLFTEDRSKFRKTAYLYAGLTYIAIPLTLTNFITLKGVEFNAVLLLCFFAIIWCSDIGAYAIGSLLGSKYGKKLCPSISPMKSWAGFWGGLAFTILAVFILKATGLMEFPALHCIVLAVIMHVAGVFGDLFESQWKRTVGVKDSGKVIPGHGGLLDRFDSAIFAVPAGAIYLALFNLL